MKEYNFQPEFTDAVNSGDISKMRSFVAATIRIDPTFGKSKCDACMEYIREKGIDITEEFKQNINERCVPANPAEWTKELFQDKVEDLRQNFAYNERIGELKKIGQVVYAERIKEKLSDEKKSSPTFTEAPKGRRSKKKNSSLTTIIGAVAAVAAVIAVIVLFLKK